MSTTGILTNVCYPPRRGCPCVCRFAGVIVRRTSLLKRVLHAARAGASLAARRLVASSRLLLRIVMPHHSWDTTVAAPRMLPAVVSLVAFLVDPACADSVLSPIVGDGKVRIETALPHVSAQAHMVVLVERREKLVFTGAQKTVDISGAFPYAGDYSLALHALDRKPVYYQALTLRKREVWEGEVPPGDVRIVFGVDGGAWEARAPGNAPAVMAKQQGQEETRGRQ